MVGRIHGLKLVSDSQLTGYLSSLNGSNRDSGTIKKLEMSQEDMFDTITQDKSYSTPTRELHYMARDIDAAAVKQLERSELNSELVNRQFEINEWSNANKLDTLFFMQILFICLTFISTMLFLQTRQIISSSIFMTVSAIAGIIACCTLAVRARYTSVVRDSRYWQKARFPSAVSAFPTVTPPPAPSC